VALDLVAPLTALVGVLESAPLAAAGLQQTYRGVPESPGPQVAAYVALSTQRLVDKAGGLVQREARYRVGFVYAVAGAEATAETTLAAVVDAFLLAVLPERRTNLGGTVDQLSLDLSGGGEPQYVTMAGQEFRLVELDVVTTQQTTF
jgi:hypothetical protein